MRIFGQMLLSSNYFQRNGLNFIFSQEFNIPPFDCILTRNALEKLAFKSTKNVIGSLMMAKINGHLIIINHIEILPNTDLGELSLIGSKLTHS